MSFDDVSDGARLWFRAKASEDVYPSLHDSATFVALNHGANESAG